ncbi:hypothetical protein [Luteimonas saliphila]|uniref:hypothetical protein n=1 Tax=Luteimonas saliphila TaxID=2804919 RepID=UPI00192D70E7|nr:hypothetical protein [Luteimonas saliphila]
MNEVLQPPRECSWCGVDAARVRRLRGMHGPVHLVMCMACGAVTPAFVALTVEQYEALSPPQLGVQHLLMPNPSSDKAIDAAVHHWNHAPLIGPAPQRAPPPSARQQRRTLKDERDPLELLARMLVPSSYRVPVEGRSSRPGLTTSDVAAAVGFMRSRLGKAVAMAVVTRADELSIARLTDMARWRVRREVLLQRPVPLKLSRAADRWKLRLALFDAAHELVWPEKRTPYGELARRAKMRKRDYIVVHRCATHVLQEALNAARSDLREKLTRG